MKDRSHQIFMDCQLINLSKTHELLGTFENVWQFRNRLKRFIKRRLNYAKNLLHNRARRQLMQAAKQTKIGASSLNPGDMVRIRSKEEIRATLGLWNQLKGCTFMEEMWDYCGTTHPVVKRVERFMDERDFKIRKVRGLVILQDVLCQGTVDFGPCDRSCFFFWREEWLEKI